MPQLTAAMQEGFILTSGHVASGVLVLAWLCVILSARKSRLRIGILGLVGTAGHEFLHFAVGFVLCARPVSISVWPRREGDRWALGSVGFRNVGLFNAAPVAFAPLLLLWAGWALFQYGVLPAFQEGRYLTWAALCYGVACCLFSFSPSSADFKMGAVSALIYCLLSYCAWSLRLYVVSNM